MTNGRSRQRREVVERARDELLAGAALARHQRGGGVAGETLDEREDLEHLLRARDHALEGDAALQALLEDAGAVLQLALLEDGLQDALETAEVDRLLDVVGRAELDRLDGVLHVRVGAHQDELDLGIALLDAHGAARGPSSPACARRRG